MIYLLMIVLVAAMLHAVQRQRRGLLFAGVLPPALAAQILSAICLILVLYKVISIFIDKRPSDPREAHALSCETLAVSELCEMAVKEAAGEGIVVICAPSEVSSWMKTHNARLNGAKDALRDRSNVRFIELSNSDGTGWKSLDAMNAALLKCTEAKSIVLLTGLPKGAEELSSWGELQGQMLIYRGNTSAIEALMEGKMLRAFCTIKPKTRIIPDADPKLDPKANIDRYFIFFIKENFEEMRQKYDSIFPQPEEPAEN
ncbi:MAG: hypothetical protein RL095_914 [Verrucomicrobiota bacterium]|jgi:hypothetical protein